MGAAARLQQLGHKNWCIIDRNNYTGGLATTFTDPQGFLWDIGVHVLFSHYNYFNNLIEEGLLAYGNRHKVLGDNAGQIVDVSKLWVTRKRDCAIRFDNKGWIPYPFQNSFYMLEDKKVVKECFDGLFEIFRKSMVSKKKHESFHELILSLFGKGLADHFMLPYNLKVWGHPATEMNPQWIGERVAMVDLEKTLDEYINYNFLNEQEKVIAHGDRSWGPNSTYKYPLFGGTAAIWKGVGYLLDPEKVKLNTEILSIDTENKVVKCGNNVDIPYDYIISTLPIDIMMSDLIKPTSALDVEALFEKHGRPKHSKTHIVGLGFEGPQPEDLRTKSWTYHPRASTPFYRTTFFSNYSPYMVPKPGQQWSLMFEVCDTKYLPERPASSDELIDSVIQACLDEKIVSQAEVATIVSRHHFTTEYGYPTPYLNRDEFLGEVEPLLRKKLNIYSRGRFGGWKYEVSNQDHSCMQGVEAVDNILIGAEEQTFFYPDHVNSRKETTRSYP